MNPTERISRKRVALLLLVFGVTLAFAANAIAKSLRKEENKKYPLSGETKLHVQNTSGKTIVIGKNGIDEIDITVTKIVRTKDAEAAEKLMEALTYEVETKGDEVWIISRYPGSRKEEKSIWSFFKGLKHRATIDYMIEVPRDFDVHVETTSGDVDVASVDGDTKIHGTSGDVRARSIGGSSYIELTSGDINVKDVNRVVKIQLSSGSVFVDGAGGGLSLAATSGDVKAFNINGDAEVNLVSGNLNMRGCSGNLVSVSSSGDMTIEDIRGSAQVSSSSGDINIYLSLREDGKYNLSTCSGDVNVFYYSPLDIGFFLDVKTMSGSIDGNLQIRKLEKVSRRHLKGVVGDGKAVLAIATASGDISIEESE